MPPQEASSLDKQGTQLLKTAGDIPSQFDSETPKVICTIVACIKGRQKPRNIRAPNGQQVDSMPGCSARVLRFTASQELERELDDVVTQRQQMKRQEQLMSAKERRLQIECANPSVPAYFSTRTQICFPYLSLIAWHVRNPKNTVWTATAASHDQCAGTTPCFRSSGGLAPSGSTALLRSTWLSSRRPASTQRRSLRSRCRPRRTRTRRPRPWWTTAPARAGCDGRTRWGQTSPSSRPRTFRRCNRSPNVQCPAVCDAPNWASSCGAVPGRGMACG